MSIECELCESTIFVPDTIWYAGTLFSPVPAIMCGCCASCIPIESRTPALKMQPFSLTFGIVLADYNSGRNWYSAAGAINGPVRFSATPEAISRFLPSSRCFLENLYPYFCIDDFAAGIVKTYLEEKDRNPKAREVAVSLLLKYGDAVAGWLSWQKALKQGEKEEEIKIPIVKPDSAQAEKMFDELPGRLSRHYHVSGGFGGIQ